MTCSVTVTLLLLFQPFNYFISSNTLSEADALKSQRYIEHDEIAADLRVPKTMQDFVYKKMSKKIEDSIEFTEISRKKVKKQKHAAAEPCVRLLKDTDPITQIGSESENPTESIGRRKFEVKRRIIEPDDYDEEEKLKMVLVEGDQILQKTETTFWKSKKLKPDKVFNYRHKNSVLNLVEPTNEFTSLRKKNNWNESKIATFPWKKHKTVC